MPRCTATYNPGAGAHATRCVLDEHPPADNHRDQHGDEWPAQELDPGQSHGRVDR